MQKFYGKCAWKNSIKIDLEGEGVRRFGMDASGSVHGHVPYCCANGGEHSGSVTRKRESLGLGINPLKTKSRLLYLKTQFVPRIKHFSSRL